MTNLKLILAAATVAAGFAGFAGAADAKVKFRVEVNPPVYDDGYYDQGYGEDDGYRRQRFYDDRPARLSCRQVRRELRRRGWYDIEAQDCEGRFYSFIAWRNGEEYEIRVRSRDGRVVSRNPQ